MTIGQTYPPTGSPVADTPPRPPARVQDPLDGLLDATVFPEVKEHRDRFIAILRVIDNTHAGREVLHDFRTLAKRGKFPAIEILETGTASLTQSATRTHSLLLTKDALTAGAREIGVLPEGEQAPVVLFRLAEIRNVLAAELKGKGGHFQTPAVDVIDVPLDPVLVRARFREELQAPQGARSSSGVPDTNMGKVLPVVMPPGPHGSSQDTHFNDGESTRKNSGSGLGNTDRVPLLGAPPNKLSTVSNPYCPVTVEAGTSVEKSQAGKVWRAFQWVQRTLQTFLNFALRRREASGDVGGNPEIGASASPGVERPILKDARPSHRRTQSIRIRNEVDPEQGGHSAAPKP